MPKFGKGAEYRVQMSQLDKEQIRKEDERERKRAKTAAEPVEKPLDIKEALRDLEAKEKEEFMELPSAKEWETKYPGSPIPAAIRKADRLRRERTIEGEEAAREHRRHEGKLSPEETNAIPGETKRTRAYEATFGLEETPEEREQRKRPAPAVMKVVERAMPGLEKGVKHPVADMHFQQKVEETKKILGQEKAFALWNEVFPLLGKDSSAATRYVFEFGNIAKDAEAKDPKELQDDIRALNEKYELPENYNPMRAETTKMKKPRQDRYETRGVTPTHVEKWQDQMSALNEDLHRQLAERLSEPLTPAKKERVDAISDRIKQTEAELQKIARYKDLGAELGAEAMTYELRLTELAKKMSVLSDQINEAYGKTPEELRGLGGLSLATARVKNWLRSLAGRQPLLTEWETLNTEHNDIAELLEDYRSTYRASPGEAGKVRLPSKHEREREEHLREIAPATPGIAGMTEEEYEKRMEETAGVERARDIVTGVPNGRELFELVAERTGIDEAAEQFIVKAREYLDASKYGVESVVREFEKEVEGLGIEKAPEIKALFAKARAERPKVVPLRFKRPTPRVETAEAKFDRYRNRFDAIEAGLLKNQHPSPKDYENAGWAIERLATEAELGKTADERSTGLMEMMKRAAEGYLALSTEEEKRIAERAEQRKKEEAAELAEATAGFEAAHAEMKAHEGKTVDAFVMSLIGLRRADASAKGAYAKKLDLLQRARFGDAKAVAELGQEVSGWTEEDFEEANIRFQKQIQQEFGREDIRTRKRAAAEAFERETKTPPSRIEEKLVQPQASKGGKRRARPAAQRPRPTSNE